jgi:hypothetical protein
MKVEGPGGERTGFLVNIFRRLVEFVSGGSAAAPAAAQETAAPAPKRKPRESLVFASAPGGPQALVHVTPGDLPIFERSDVCNIFLLDLEEFRLEEAVLWVEKANYVNQLGEEGHVPSILVVAPNRPLSKDELHLITERLRPAGAKFTSRPRDCARTMDVLNALREEYRRMVGLCRADRPWRKDSRLGARTLSKGLA